MLVTRINDSRIIGHNTAQLTGWRANVDMQVSTNAEMVTKYTCKYASKSEVLSEPLKKTFKAIVDDLDDHPNKAVQKLLTKTVAEHDYSAQETCHLLLGEKLVTCSRSFVIVGVDGQREVDLETGVNSKRATRSSVLDHYMKRPQSSQFANMCLDEFTKQYNVNRSGGIAKRAKEAVVRYVPYVKVATENDPEKYEAYCYRQLLKYTPFRAVEDLTADFDGNAASTWKDWGSQLSSSLADRIRLVEAVQQGEGQEQTNADELEPQSEETSRYHTTEDRMAMCQLAPDLSDSNTNGEDSGLAVDWTASLANFQDPQEAVCSISRNRSEQTTAAVVDHTQINYNPALLQGNQEMVYNAVQSHFEAVIQGQSPESFRLIVSGTAGTGKSYRIGCLRALVEDACYVAAPTGVAAFNVGGQTLHSLLRLQLNFSDCNELKGPTLQDLQEKLAMCHYLIVDEMSMIGRRQMGMIHSRLCQVFPGRSSQPFGGTSLILVGDFGQLPPVGDTSLYMAAAKGVLSNKGRAMYAEFGAAVVLTQVMRQAGSDPAQVRFREGLLRLINAEVT